MLAKKRVLFGAGWFLLVLAGSFVVAHVDGQNDASRDGLGTASVAAGSNADESLGKSVLPDLDGHELAGSEAHSSGFYDVSHFDAPPSVSISIQEDEASGWNIQLETENFQLSPESVNQAPVDGQGHANLYLNEKKVARLYGLWYHLDDLPAGDYSIKVRLNGNDHSILSIGQEPIEVTALVTQQ